MKKHYKWMKPFIGLTLAATLTSVVSAGLSFALITGSGYTKSIIKTTDRADVNSQELTYALNQSHRVSQPIHIRVTDLHPRSISVRESQSSAITISTKPGLEQQSTVSSIRQAAQDAINALSKHQPFSSWKGAHADIQALGPGTHGYIVHVRSKSNESLGYLIIYATEEGKFSLSEYGLGELYPFAPQSIDMALSHLEWTNKEEITVTPYYIQPLVPVWKLQYKAETKWIDATTGDVLPTDDPLWMSIPSSEASTAPLTVRTSASNRTSKNSQDLSTSVVINGILPSTSEDQASNPRITLLNADRPLLADVFDPYDQISWMASPVKLQGIEAGNWLQNWNPSQNTHKFVYVQQLIAGSGAVDKQLKMKFPFALIGEQLWNNDTSVRYIALKPSGEAAVRFISEQAFTNNTSSYIAPVIEQASSL